MLYDEKTESLRITETASENGMRKLPDWVIANKYPAIYDLESTTAIEQTARLYGAVQTLIENYNTFITIVEEEITKMVEQYAFDNETHEVSVRQIIQDFFDGVETMLQLQNTKITNIENLFSINLEKTINDAIANGSITLNLRHDEANENLYLIVSNNGNDVVYDEPTESLYM